MYIALFRGHDFDCLDKVRMLDVIAMSPGSKLCDPEVRPCESCRKIGVRLNPPIQFKFLWTQN